MCIRDRIQAGLHKFFLLPLPGKVGNVLDVYKRQTLYIINNVPCTGFGKDKYGQGDGDRA